jgi:hypothetical protein
MLPLCGGPSSDPKVLQSHTDLIIMRAGSAPLTGSWMRKDRSTDYETYREIMGELLRPIESHDLDVDTLKRLYESKLVYLENLRVKCFVEVNGQGTESLFTMDDYRLILKALDETNRHLRDLILCAITTKLKQRAS